jgi:TolB-like protein
MPALPDDRLDSWKAIAVYLNRSVRTVRRWERDEGLPVHRHVHRTLGTIYAHRSELDAWQLAAHRAPAPSSEPAKSIAVLPFQNLSVDAENEYFADGLTEEITITLSKLRALRVTSRTSSRTVRNSAKDISAIGAQLGVRYVVEGTVRRAGDRLRITAQLIDAPADDHVWGETFDGTVDDVFAIQERIARVIVDALKLRLSADEDEHLSERWIANLPAYDCYLRARHELWRWRKDAIDHAIDLLQNALAIIGENEKLLATLGLAYLQYREAAIDLTDRPITEAERCAARVFAIRPESGDALRLRGWIQYSRGDVQSAVRDLKSALAAQPGDADTLLLLSNCYLISGRVSHARPLIQRLLEIDPLTPLTRCMPAFADVMEGNLTDTVEPYRQMFEMDRSNPMARLFYIWALILNGRRDESKLLAEDFSAEVRETVPARIASFLAFGATAAITREVETMASATEMFPRLLAQGFAMLGMTEPAMRWLTIAIERGFINYPFLSKHDPFIAFLRDDARFQDAMESVRERWERFEA